MDLESLCISRAELNQKNTVGSTFWVVAAFAKIKFRLAMHSAYGYLEPALCEENRERKME